MKKLLVCLLLFVFGGLQAQQNFTQKQVLEDLEVLKSLLEEGHYNLYAYTPKEEFDQHYEMVKSSLDKDSFNLLEITNAFKHLVTKVKNGHTEITFPGQLYGEYLYAGGTLFPLEITFEDGKALVRKNWSGDNDIKIGAEVVSINDGSICEVLKPMESLISAERSYFQKAKIELYSFPRIYWQAYGQQDEFTVEIRSNGQIKSYQLTAVKGIDDFEMKRNEIFGNGRTLKFFENAAYLLPGDFSGDEAKFQHFIDSAFVAINQSKTQNLIIDLRNNLGGDDPFSNYLVSYFADQPFKWNSELQVKSSSYLKEHVKQKFGSSSAYRKEVLQQEDGEFYDQSSEVYNPQPKTKRFKGNVYVLVNRQSHSQAAVTAAQIQDYNFGTIVGEETGEYPSLYASVFRFTLPITGIEVQVAKGKIVRVNGNTDERGVIPDIEIRDHLLDEDDEVLEGLLARLKK